ncbi:MAG: dephospho-CoA kinase [Chryseotalea sp. WA131a]|jgi:dephospho-CoA kinase|nr:MAG: dephospho-CoA kinase [Chryseotalea sp. WA131a]
MRPLQIGITGGIGSGKSMVCKIFGCLGIPVYDADSRAKSIMTTDGILVEQIKKEFGSLSYDADGGLNRSFLSSAVFGNAEKLKKLNELVHPRVALDGDQWTAEQIGKKYVVREAALLFESGSYKKMDKIIVVTAPEPLRVKRVLVRDKQRTEEEVLKIIRNQIKEEEKVKKADFVLRNDETELLVPQVINLHQKFLMLSPA